MPHFHARYSNYRANFVIIQTMEEKAVLGQSQSEHGRKFKSPDLSSEKTEKSLVHEKAGSKKVEKKKERDERIEAERAKKLKKVTLVFSSVKDLKDPIRQIQDSKDVKDSEELQNRLREILSDTGAYTTKELEAMGTAKLIVESQVVLRHVQIGDITDKDLEFLSEIPEAIREDFAKAMIRKEELEVEKAKGLDGEEKLTEEKVANYLVPHNDSLPVSVDERSRRVDSIEPKRDSLLVAEGKIGLMPYAVYKREGGGYSMSRLGSRDYQQQQLMAIFEKVGINFVAPNNFDSSSVGEKIEILKKQGIHTIDALNFKPIDWGEQTPNNTPSMTLSFKELMLEKWHFLQIPNYAHPNFALVDIQNEIDRRINTHDIRWVMSARLDLDEYIGSATPAQIAILDQLVPVAQRQQVLQTELQLNNIYQQRINAMNSTQRKKRLGDIDGALVSELSAVRSGYHPIDYAKNQVLRAAFESPDLPGDEGLRMWYGFTEIAKLDQAYEIYTRFQIKADARENIETAYDVMRFFSKSRSIDSLTLARQQLTEILRAVEQSPDPAITQEMKDRLRKQRDAFESITPIWIVMHQREGDPEQLLGVVSAVEDDHWFYYYDIYKNIRDSEGKGYLVDEHENDLNLNILSEAKNAFIFQYMVDRSRVNKMRNASRFDLDFNTDNPDLQWVIRRFAEKANLGLAPNFNLANLNAAQRQQIENLWNDAIVKKDVTREWYNEETFIGVDGFDFNANRQRVELRIDQIVDNILRQRLLNATVDPQRVEALLGAPNLVGGDQDLIGAIKNIGFQLAKFEMASTLDRFRVYNQQGELVASHFGEETPFIAREVDQIADYFFSEGHGRPEQNQLLMEQMDDWWGIEGENNEGFMLGSNSTLFRVIWEMKMKKLLPQHMVDRIDQGIEHERQRIANRTGLSSLEEVPEIDVAHYVVLDEVMKGFDPDALNADGQGLDLFNIRWDQTATAIDHYLLGDNTQDRTNTLKTYRDTMKKFILNPTEANFFNMMDNWYSTRLVRKQPHALFMLRLFWKYGQHWKEWFDYQQNLTSPKMEMVIQGAITEDIITRDQGEQLKTELLGTPMSRPFNQIGLFAFESAKKLLSPGYILGSIWDLIVRIAAYAGKQ